MSGHRSLLCSFESTPASRRRFLYVSSQSSRMLHPAFSYSQGLHSGSRLTESASALAILGLPTADMASRNLCAVVGKYISRRDDNLAIAQIGQSDVQADRNSGIRKLVKLSGGRACLPAEPDLQLIRRPADKLLDPMPLRPPPPFRHAETFQRCKADSKRSRYDPTCFHDLKPHAVRTQRCVQLN